MRINVGIAVAGKVFGGRQHSVLVRALDVGRGHLADEGRVLTEGSRVDYGIGGIGVDIGVGEPVPLHSDGARFHGGDAPGLAGIVEIVGSAEGHGMRESGDFVQTHAQASLEIGSEDERKLRVFLQLVGDHRGFERLVLVEEAVFVLDGEAEAAKMIFAHGIAQAEVLTAVHIEELCA